MRESFGNIVRETNGNSRAYFSRRKVTRRIRAKSKASLRMERASQSLTRPAMEAIAHVSYADVNASHVGKR